MVDISYRIVARGKSGFDVEMEKPDGRTQTVPGFHSEHEADAWIVQAKRMIRDASPWTPLPPRKPVPSTAGEPTKSLPLEQAEPTPATPHVAAAATPRAPPKPARERYDTPG